MSISFSDYMNPAPPIRPMLNIGAGLDTMTGRWVPGMRGEMILNGGLAQVTGIAGRGNTFKSTIGWYMLLMALSRYLCATASPYDTEMSLTYQRLYQLAAAMENIGGVDLFEEKRLFITDSVAQLGDAWFDMLKKFMNEFAKDKKNMRTLPFAIKGEFYRALLPSISAIDSVSQWTSSGVEEQHDKHMVGASGNNTEAMKSGAAKSQMLMQMPALMGSTGGYVLMMAHIGDEIVMDQYAPSTKKLQQMRGNQKFKNVPEKFTFLTNNCWECMAAPPLRNKSTKGPEYPLKGVEDVEGDTDLVMVSVKNLRNKSGPTGMPFEIIVSQREGVLGPLTEFHLIKEMARFGLGGNDKSYYLELLPDVNLSRTTIRSKLNESAVLRRAMNITSELCQIGMYRMDIGDTPLVSAKELYEGLKAKGYDWSVLLNTRGYWMYEEDVTPQTLPFLSTLDLLRMHSGEYHPYWHEPVKQLSGKSSETLATVSTPPLKK